MRQLDLWITDQGSSLRVWVADRWWNRGRGLLGRPPLRPGQGLLLTPCSSVHGMGMTRAIDVAFLDKRGTIVKLDLLRPMGIAWHLHASQVLEMPAGEIQRLGLKCGQQVGMRK